MSIQPELKTVLKRLKLSGMLATLPDRLAYARKEKLDYAQLLELVLSDEVERRDQKHVSNRLSAAGFEKSARSNVSIGPRKSASTRRGLRTCSASTSSN